MFIGDTITYLRRLTIATLLQFLKWKNGKMESLDKGGTRSS